MTIEALLAGPTEQLGGQARDRAGLMASWPVLLGLILMAVPTIFALGKQTWSTEAGAHGPIVIASGLWLFYYNGISFARRQTPAVWAWSVPAVLGWLSYAVGRAFDFLSLEVGGFYLVGVAAAVAMFGTQEVKRNLFPLLYLAFIIPIPGFMMDALTMPLRTFVSFVSVDLLQFLHYPVSRDGVALSIAQYQLLVEDACSGMNSLIGLTAVSLLYIYLTHRASWRYSALLVALIVPIAVFVNLVRVVALILLTYYYGDAVAQGFLHKTLGMSLFVFALVVIYVLDVALQRLLGRHFAGAA